MIEKIILGHKYDISNIAKRRPEALTLSKAELLDYRFLRQDIRCGRKGHTSADVSPAVIAEAFGLAEGPSEGVGLPERE